MEVYLLHSMLGEFVKKRVNKWWQVVQCCPMQRSSIADPYYILKTWIFPDVNECIRLFSLFWAMLLLLLLLSKIDETQLSNNGTAPTRGCGLWENLRVIQIGPMCCPVWETQSLEMVLDLFRNGIFKVKKWVKHWYTGKRGVEKYEDIDGDTCKWDVLNNRDVIF